MTGTTLGLRFTGLAPAQGLSALKPSFANFAVTMSLAMLAAVLLYQVAGERIEAVIPGFAAGGLGEMSLIAASLNVWLLYVSIHHLLRIVLAIMLARKLAPWPDLR